MASRFLLGMSATAAVVVGFAACGNSDGDADTSTTGNPSSVAASSGTAGDGGAGPASSSSGAGAAPLTCTGVYSTLPEGECDLLTQEGCDPGLSCEPGQVGGVWKPKCVSNNGLKGSGKICASSNECQAGLFCVFNQCAPVCCPTTNEPCAGGTCNVEFSGETMNYAPDFITLCAFLEKCQLLTDDACPPGKDCHLQDFEQGLAVCVPPNGANVPEGGTCMYLNDCGNMLMCFNSKCRFNCFLSDMGMGTPGLGGCPAGQACVEGDFGVEDIGVCQ